MNGANADADVVAQAIAASGASVLGQERMTVRVGGLEQISLELVRRAAHADGVGDVDVFSFECPGEKPSCRNKRQVGGETWWVGSEDGRTVVCIPGCHDGAYVAVVGTQAEETLLKLASTLRCSLGPRQ